jgi:hypothetical protein
MLAWLRCLHAGRLVMRMRLFEASLTVDAAHGQRTITGPVPAQKHPCRIRAANA